MEHLVRLVEHMGWADVRVLEALRSADSDDPRLLELYGHLLAAEHVWFTRLAGIPADLPVWPALGLAECARIGAENLERYRRFVAALDPADLDAGVSYTNSAGQTFTTGVQDILLHVALHGSYHCGQIAAALRGEGRVPASTDYIAWVRGVPAATRIGRPKLRTPDERFEGLADFPFEPRYQEVDGLRIHFVDEGPRDGEVVLLLHGEPTWSYLYRRMIPIIADTGFRVVAPDLIGFGRSDKLIHPADYSYALQVDLMKRFVNSLDLRGVTLVGHDWGGLIGLRVLAELPDRFARAVMSNTGLPDGTMPANPAFLAWRDYSQSTADFRTGRIIARGTVDGLPPEAIAGYDAPFPDAAYQAALRRFPMLVPTSPDDPAVPANRAAWEVLERWNGPFLTAFSDRDPITAGGEKAFQRRIPGARGQRHVTIEGAGHFLQEDRGPELAAVIVDFIRSHPA